MQYDHTAIGKLEAELFSRFLHIFYENLTLNGGDKSQVIVLGCQRLVHCGHTDWGLGSMISIYHHHSKLKFYGKKYEKKRKKIASGLIRSDFPLVLLI